MLVAITPRGELLATVRAHERLHLEVHPEMVEHVAVLKRRLDAFGAPVDFVRFFIDDFYISFEVILELMILGSADHDAFVGVVI